MSSGLVTPPPHPLPPLPRYFPFGIIFLVAGKILDMQDPSTLGRKLGWYGITVLSGLFVHGLVLLPLFYFLLTKKNPFSYIRGLLQALVIALATSSRSEDWTRLDLNKTWTRLDQTGQDGADKLCLLILVPGLCFQLSYVAHHHEVSPGKLSRRSSDRSLCASRGRHHQHGWNCTV